MRDIAAAAPRPVARDSEDSRPHSFASVQLMGGPGLHIVVTSLGPPGVSITMSFTEQDVLDQNPSRESECLCNLAVVTKAIAGGAGTGVVW